MRLFIRASSVFAVVMAAVWPLASAASPEATCIIARDAAIAKIKAMDKANTDKANTDKAKPASSNGDDSALLAAEEKARKGLEVQMRAILGPVAIKGLEGEGAINLDTLIEGDEDFGLLDGMVYGPIDAKTRVIVTTDGLLRRWLHQHKDWWGKDSPSLPQDPCAPVKVDALYTQAVQNDAAIMRFAVLPVRKPAGADFAFAMLAARSQSDVPAKADEIFIVTARGGRVFIGYTKEFDAVGPIASCDQTRDDLVKKFVAAAEEPGLSDAAREKKSQALSGKSDTEFLRCFAEKASQHNAFAGAMTAAQALLDRLPLH
ncbi:MAG: hypothetical protein WCD52_24980 [Xanthobacteraceae bacterium]